MQVLALVPGGIGDQILFFPTLNQIKRFYPDATIDVVAEPRSRGAYRVCQAVRNVVPFDFKGSNSLGDWSNLLGTIRDREYDVVMSLGKRWVVKLLLWMTGVPIRIGFDGPGDFLLTHPIPLKTEQYAAQMYHDLLQGMGITAPCPELAIDLPKDDLAWAKAEQTRLSLPQERGYVMIHGGSSRVARDKGINRMFPLSGWQMVIADFQKRQPDLPIVLIQGPDDREFVAQLLETFPNLKVTSPGNVGQLAAMIAGANLMICNDSAPMHLAVAVQTYTIGLFGPTNPTKSLPQSDRVRSVKSPTDQMADIDPATVIAQIWGDS